MQHNMYHDAINWEQLRQEHPIGDDFVKFGKNSRDEIRAHQEKLFARCVARAWQIPFYQRLWGNAGLEAGDIKGLDTLSDLPMFDKSDIMESIDLNPPFGDFGGLEGTGNGRSPGR